MPRAVASRSPCSRRSTVPLERALGGRDGRGVRRPPPRPRRRPAPRRRRRRARGHRPGRGRAPRPTARRSRPTVVVVGIGVTPEHRVARGLGPQHRRRRRVPTRRCVAAPGRGGRRRHRPLAQRPLRRGCCGSSTGRTRIQMGEAAARRLLAEHHGAEPEVFDPVPWFWSDQYDRKIQLAGRSRRRRRGRGRRRLDRGAPVRRRCTAGTAGSSACSGMNRPRHVMQLRRLVEEPHVVGRRPGPGPRAGLIRPERGGGATRRGWRRGRRGGTPARPG